MEDLIIRKPQGQDDGFAWHPEYAMHPFAKIVKPSRSFTKSWAVYYLDTIDNIPGFSRHPNICFRTWEQAEREVKLTAKVCEPEQLGLTEKMRLKAA